MAKKKAAHHKTKSTHKSSHPHHAKAAHHATTHHKAPHHTSTKSVHGHPVSHHLLGHHYKAGASIGHQDRHHAKSGSIHVHNANAAAMTKAVGGKVKKNHPAQAKPNAARVRALAGSHPTHHKTAVTHPILDIITTSVGVSTHYHLIPAPTLHTPGLIRHPHG